MRTYIDEVKERAAKATPDWRCEVKEGFPLLFVGNRTVTIWHSRNREQQVEAIADSEFAAHARTDIPELVRRLEIAEEAIAAAVLGRELGMNLNISAEMALRQALAAIRAPGRSA
jgi:hypothetical protein